MRRDVVEGRFIIHEKSRNRKDRGGQRKNEDE